VLGGESDLDLLKAAAAAGATLKNSETCEGNYFIGLVKSAAAQTTDAGEAYQRAVGTRARDLAAYRGATFALKKMNPATASTAKGEVIPSSGTSPAKNGVK
jgi:hypothetical protein